MSKLLTYLKIFGEILLAVLSFLFYKTVRFCLQQIVRFHPATNQQQAGEWRVLNGRVLESSFILPVLATSAPRWNTHAMIAIAGPWHVNKSIRLRLDTAVQATKTWTVNVSPGHQIVANLSIPDAETDSLLTLEPGEYRVTLRYYNWTAPLQLPTVEVDGVEVVSAAAIPADSNDFYHQLSSKSNLFYLSLHYYVGTLLRYQNRLPKSFVEREFLPVGNPDTEFYYGFLPAGQSLSLQLYAPLRQAYSCYLTLFNRASFPVFWTTVTDNKFVTPPIEENSLYLIRVHKHKAASPSFHRDWLQLHLLTPHRNKQQINLSPL